MLVSSRSIYTCGLLVALTVPYGHAGAQEPLEVNRYVEIVLRSHPLAAQSSGLEAAASAEAKAARLFPDPVFEFSRGRGTLTEAPGNRASETGYSVSQTIPWPGTFSAGIRAGDRAAEGLNAVAEDLRWELEVEARRTFARLAAARAFLDIARAAEEDARSLRDLVTRRAELGESRESDRIRAVVEWLRQERRVAAAEREAETAEAILRALAVEPLPRPLAVQAAPHPPLPPIDWEELVTRLVERNPRLRAAVAEAGLREALLSVAGRGRFPDIEVTVFRQEEVDKEASGFSLGIKLPLWNANRGDIARAQAATRVSEAEAERIRVELVTEFETRLKELRIAAEQASLLDGDILPSATQSVGLARFSYEEGETSLLDLLDAQRTYRDTQREAVEAHLALSLGVAEVQRLVGPDFNPWR